jgi:hypothetical protein
MTVPEQRSELSACMRPHLIEAAADALPPAADAQPPAAATAAAAGGRLVQGALEVRLMLL